MAASKREREAGGAGSSRLQLPLQVALGAALALLVLGWNSQRSSTAPQPQQPQLYVNDLSLPLDVGAVERQDEADLWCAPRPAPSWPPTDEQLRQLRVAVVIDPVCHRQEQMPEEKLKACLDVIISHCRDTTKNGCFGGWGNKAPECKDVLPLDKWPDGTRPPVKWGHYQLWWQTIMTSIAPHLRTGGWGNLKLISDPKSASERRMASCADLLITSTVMFWQLYPFKHFMRPWQRLILVEQYGAGTFMVPADMEQFTEANRTLAIVKHVLVDPPEHQNGPYIEERAHLALMAPLIKDGQKYLTMRERPWKQATLDKMEVLLPMTVRFSNPIQCGGSWGFSRFHGFFTKNHNRWPIPPLAERPYDVTFIGKLEYEAKAEVSGVTTHRQAAVKALSAFRDKWGHQYKVYVPQGERLEYHEYIALLKQSKLVLSPWGWGEWSHKDFEILMAGCLIIKPRADIFKIHPNIFQHNVTAISTKEDLSDLEQQVLPFLKDLPRAQTAATRAQGLFRHYSRPEVLAKDWDELLLRKLRESFTQEQQAALAEAEALGEARRPQLEKEDEAIAVEEELRRQEEEERLRLAAEAEAAKAAGAEQAETEAAGEQAAAAAEQQDGARRR
ncbi:hypothetical protein C2E20_0555 [Micractinium conductrix]|uniref:Uncharacterized protein n=1 Tax=Micractinium conductrix TaxID=554055 RepID=A0A2P6VS95_9CHLO|nr:hypothetical protein C2E20_0555 [Micractinium conductrix]|eukprot:PSC76930.1 hypothetical protein C2E20_0555 [Micractinium conductrix]